MAYIVMLKWMLVVPSQVDLIVLYIRLAELLCLFLCLQDLQNVSTFTMQDLDPPNRNHHHVK
jgi:hypothetical protein